MMENGNISSYLKEIDFQSRLDNIVNKLNGKSVLVYGAGALFQEIHRCYDLSGLNIIAISDKKFANVDRTKLFGGGYKTCSPVDIIKLNPDCVLISTYKFFETMKYLYDNNFVNNQIKVRPMLKVDFSELVKQIWL